MTDTPTSSTADRQHHYGASLVLYGSRLWGRDMAFVQLSKRALRLRQSQQESHQRLRLATVLT